MGSNRPVVACSPLLPALQDIFSLGCVIAELWLGEGRAFFDLGTLLAYRRGEYDPAKELMGVTPDIAELVMHMIQRAPGGSHTPMQQLWQQQCSKERVYVVEQ